MRWAKKVLFWPAFLLGHLLAVSLLAWHLLAQVNFVYPLGYRLLNIEQHIQEFGPSNRYKQDFAQTTPAEHLDLFAQITRAVQNHGQGLAEISYRLPDGTTTLLMRNAEVIHLQDVANLIDVFYGAGIIGALIWMVLLGIAFKKQFSLPPLKKILLGFLTSIIGITLVIFITGPTKVFYWLHEQIFPDEHEWFFYYQDSLMTTLMKAPDLFGFIAVILVILMMLLWSLTIWGMIKLLPSLAQQLPQSSQKKRRKK